MGIARIMRANGFNHMSFVDVLLLLASADRPIRFLMFQDIYDLPLMKPFARMMRDRRSPRGALSPGRARCQIAGRM